MVAAGPECARPFWGRRALCETNIMARALVWVKDAARIDGWNSEVDSMAKLRRKGRFVAWYIHYRTGRIMRAADYGYKAWPF